MASILLDHEFSNQAIERVILERIPFCMNAALPVDWRDLRVDVQSAPWADAMLVRLTRYIWGKIDSRDEHKYPETWRDAFKLRWFPRWALKRWPVRYVVIKVERGGIYPTLNGSPGVGWQRIEVLRHG